MNKLFCFLFQNDLTAFLHSELPSWKTALVRQHLLHCDQCSAQLHDIQGISTAFQGSESPAENDIFDAALRERILSGLPGSAAPASEIAPRFSRQRPLWMAWGLSAATACVAAAMLIPAYTRSQENARRSSTQSNLKRIGMGLAAYQSETQEREMPPSAGPAAAKNEKHLDGANYAFMDGRVKWLERNQKENAGAVRGRNALSSEAATQAFKRRSAGTAGAANSPSNQPSTKIVLKPYRRVHKEGSLTVEVRALEQSSDEVESLIKKAGGFVASNTLSTQPDGLQVAWLEIRVPITAFDETIKNIAALGEVKSKTVKGEDITAQVSDADEENNIIADDLRSKQQKYIAAKKRAAENKKTVPDEWRQRSDIRQMRIQLAQVRARLELLEKMSEFANLSVQLKGRVGTNSGGFMSDIGVGRGTAYDTFLTAVRLPINLFIYILAYIPLWLPLLFAWRYFLRRYPSNARPFA